MNATRTAQYFLLAPTFIVNSDVSTVIESALQKTGLRPVFSETATQYSWDAVRSIERADLIIADLTGSSPDVMYWIGFAHALKRPVLFIVQEGSGPIPDQVSGNLFFPYDPAKPDELDRRIRAGVALYMPNRSKASVNE